MNPKLAPLLAVALNGSREHQRLPRTPAELAAAARACVDAGAEVIHLHAYDAAGRETLAAEPCARALSAVRAACPGVPISLSTSAAIEPDPGRRMELVAGWTVLPELVTANQGEAGIAELCEHLLARGVGIEAGLLCLADAEAFVRSGLADRCVRVLVEPLDVEPEAALAHAAAMEAVLAGAGISATCAVLAVSSLLAWREPGTAYRLAGSLLYLAGTFLVTLAFNVPRNNALAAVDPASAEGARLWSGYVASWTAWNHLRTAAALLAAAALTLALG